MESIEKVGKLLEKFYLGETTLGEEQWLEEYFSATTVPQELLPDKELFQTLRSSAGPVKVPADLNKKILETIDREERKDVKTRRISMFSLSGLAAGLLALVAVYVFFLRTDEPALLADQQWTDTYEDPMMAYEEAKRALTFVSAKLNVGTGELENFQQISKTATDPLHSLSKINKGSKELSLLGQLHRVREFE
jgi:hypothetical protein